MLSTFSVQRLSLVLSALLLFVGKSSLFAPTAAQPEGVSLLVTRGLHDGRLLWRAEGRESIVAVAEIDSRLVTQSVRGVIEVRKGTTGEVLWRRDVEADLPSQIAHTSNLVFVVDGRGALLALELENGQIRWKAAATAESRFLAKTASSSHGLVTAAQSNGAMMGLDAQTGKRRWRSDVLTASPAQLAGPEIGSAGPYNAGLVNLVVTERDSLIAVDVRTGVVRWEADDLGSAIGFPPTDVGDAIVLRSAVGPMSNLLGVSAQTGERLWEAILLGALPHVASDAAGLYALVPAGESYEAALLVYVEGSSGTTSQVANVSVCCSVFAPPSADAPDKFALLDETSGATAVFSLSTMTAVWSKAAENPRALDHLLAVSPRRVVSVQVPIP